MSVTNVSPKKHITVYIGRFQPFHSGHKAVLDYALSKSDKVIVLLGSANRPRTFENPFTWQERKMMIVRNYEGVNYDKLIFSPLNDYDYDNLVWATNVRNIVDNILFDMEIDSEDVVLNLIGPKKDDSSFYLDMFPEWNYIETPSEFFIKDLHATDIRKIYFTQPTNKSIDMFRDKITPSVASLLEQFMMTPHFGKLANEYGYIEKYKKSWSVAPYPVTFVTTDAVVIQSGHVLLIERKAEPGKGLWALPGGFLNQNELIEDCMIRELREETKLKVPDPVLRGCIKEIKVFDKTNRSFRGRTITHAYFIHLKNGELPRVKGSDDAIAAKWIPLNEVKAETMFEDHFGIIQYFVGNI